MVNHVWSLQAYGVGCECVYVCVFEGILCAYGGGCVCVQWDKGGC